MTLTLRMDGSAVERLVAGIEQALDMKGALGKSIAGVLRADAKRQFQEGGIPPWASLNDRTVQEKRRLGYPRLTRKGLVPVSLMQRGGFGPGNILIRTAALFSSWTNGQDPHHVENLEADGVGIGSALPYAEYHQRGNRKLPRRAIVVTDDAKTKAAAAVTAAITEGK